MMKVPLFLLLTLFTLCLFSACEKNKGYYYYCDNPCNNLKGKVKKVTDTAYYVENGEITYPAYVREFSIDSLQRLVEQSVFHYDMVFNESGQPDSISVSSRHLSKHRYDRDGRRVESRHCSDASCYSLTLIRQEGNIEVWEKSFEVSQTVAEYIPSTLVNYRYEKNRRVTEYMSGERKEMEVIDSFDIHKNLIEYRATMGDKEYHITYIYNSDNLLTEIRDSSGDTTYFRYEEFDNAGNWMKQTELDANNEIRYIIRRRIEYAL